MPICTPFLHSAMLSKFSAARRQLVLVAPNGLEICGAPLWGSRPASRVFGFAAKLGLAGPVGSGELLRGVGTLHRERGVTPRSGSD